MQEKVTTNIFLTSALAEIPRLLGQMNRNPGSETYGSFDRAFWHYRTNDISCARYQEAVYTLALLYVTPFEGNRYFQNACVYEWIQAALTFTISIQHKDGSFDEWYLNEGSFVGTAFVTNALAETYLLLGEKNVTRYRAVHRMLTCAGDWLLAHEDTSARNQTAGAISALQKVYLITKNEKYKRAAEGKLEKFLDAQHEEGWWEEYGGPDIGYLSLTVEYLTRYCEDVYDRRVTKAIERAVGFLSHFLHPDMTVGGEYMARNTEYLIPSGFFRKINGVDTAIVRTFITKALEQERGITPHALDDRYLCYILYNWIEAGIRYVPDSHLDLWGRRFETYFEDSGIHVRQDDRTYFVSNAYKGGSFRLYTQGGAVFDAGLIFTVDGITYTTGALNQKLSVSREGGRYLTRGSATRIHEPLLTTVRMIIFKSVQRAVGFVPALQIYVKHALRRAAITYSDAPHTISFERIIVHTDTGVRIEDTIDAPVPEGALSAGVKSSYLLVPSSKYFVSSEVDTLLQPDSVVYATEDGRTRLVREFLVD